MSDLPNQCKAPRFSFILPAFNEAENLTAMQRRLNYVGEQLTETYETVWVNDGSSDDTESILDAIASEDSRVRVIHLSRNFGHMAALAAGLSAARATGAVICLDSDGQHPPELIPAMVARWSAGADVVQTLRKVTADESWFKRWSSRLFYILLNRLAEVQLPEGAADFRLLDRQVVDALNSIPERARFLRGLVFWVGFRFETLPYEAPARMAGKTKYSIIKMLLFALSGITSFSVRPLRLIFVLGLIIIAFAMLYSVFVIWAYFFRGDLVTGWTSLLLTVLFLSGTQLLTLGVASEYLGRIFEEVKRRPLYLVRRPRSRDESHD